MNNPAQTTRFKDNKGRNWSVDVDVVSVRKIRAELGVDLLDMLNGRPDSLKKLIEDPETLVDALYLICQEQCEKQQLTPEDFGRGLFGEAIDDAVDALLVGLARFFPKGRRELILRVVEKLHESQAQMIAKALEALDSENVTRAIDRESEAAVARFYADLENQAETPPSTGGGSLPS